MGGGKKATALWANFRLMLTKLFEQHFLKCMLRRKENKGKWINTVELDINTS